MKKYSFADMQRLHWKDYEFECQRLTLPDGRQIRLTDSQNKQVQTKYTQYIDQHHHAAHGRVYFPEQGGEVMGVTLREWSQQWLEVYVKPVAKPSGYEHYYDNLHKHILPKLGDMPLKSLTTAVVQHFLNEESLHGNLRTGGALSAKSIKNMRVVLDVCCKRAVADGLMAANPVAATVYTHCRSKKHNIMSDSDQKVLEKWLFSDLSLNNAGIILALYSGMRLGEVCAARWGNYDAMSGTLPVSYTHLTLPTILLV